LLSSTGSTLTATTNESGAKMPEQPLSRGLTRAKALLDLHDKGYTVYTRAGIDFLAFNDQHVAFGFVQVGRKLSPRKQRLHDELVSLGATTQVVQTTRKQRNPRERSRAQAA